MGNESFGKVVITDNLNKEYRYFLMVFISLIVLNENLRAIFLYKLLDRLNNMIYLNILFLFAGGIIFIKYLFKNRIDKIVVYFTAFFMVMTSINLYFNHLPKATIILFFTCILFPLIFTSIEIDPKAVKYLFNIFINVFNGLIILLLIYGVIDFLLKGQIQVFMAANILSGEIQELILLEHSWGIYRMYSFIGHPLTNASYFLYFYCLNIINNKYLSSKINRYVLILLTLIGLLLSSSKTALILGIFLMIFNSDSKHKVQYYFFLCIFAGLLYNTKIFQENLMKRFVDGIVSGDLSTGRNLLVKEFLNTNIRPALIFGGGTGYSITVSRSLLGEITNFEYPILMFALDYGVIETIFIYIIIFIYPMISFLRNKNYLLIINFLILFLYANSNNGLANLSDCFGLFCLIIVMMRGLSNYLNKEDLYIKQTTY